MDILPAGFRRAEAATGFERDPPADVALVRPVELPQGSCFVVTDGDGRPLVVALDLASAHRIARFFGLEPATVH